MIKETSKKARNTVRIMGIPVSSTELSQVLTAVEENITHNSKITIMTPNPELILASTKNYRLKKALLSSDLLIPDGIGLSQAAKFLSFSVPGNKFAKIIVTFFQGLFVGLATFFNKKYLIDYLPIIKGRELVLDLVNLAMEKKWRVYFLGGLGEEAKVAGLKLGAEYAMGPKLNDRAKPVSESDSKLENDAINQINKFNPHLLFVAFGNPKQEIWIHKNAKKLNAKCVMAVGGTFRYMSGHAKLPPKIFEKMGLEWLWRLLTEPFRLKRIFNAVIFFPLTVFLNKLRLTK